MDEIQKKFSQIYDAFVENIYRFVFLRVNSKEVAQDLTSEVFVKYWEDYKVNPDRIENPRAFLYKIAKNLVIDEYRKNSKHQIIPVDEMVMPLADPKINLEKQAVLSSDMEIVRKAISGLNADYQNAIIWRYLDDLSISEVSQLLDRSEEATRVLLHRAMKDLKNRLS